MEQKKDSLVFMDFSGIYEKQEFWKKEAALFLHFQDLSGTNCYLDEEARKEVMERIRDYSVSGIHFIDSGNYHYLSRLWMEKIRDPFCLVVFDNHTDMQLPAFGEILSCGGWIADALLGVENLKRVILIGPDEEAYSQVESDLKEKVLFFSRERLMEEWKGVERKPRIFEKEMFEDLPVYLSIDKDILCAKDACTTWSQGDTTLPQLIFCLEQLEDSVKTAGQRLIGVDICGETDPDAVEGNRENEKCNIALLNVCRKIMETNN